VDRRSTDPPALRSQLTDAVEDLQAKADEPISRIGISVAGLVDHDTGEIEQMDTVDGETVYDIPVREHLETSLGIPTTVENDANAAAVAEYTYGQGRDEESVAHVTIGTGIGGGIVTDGRLLRGADNQAGEVGVVSIDPSGSRSVYGIPGAWQAYCSGSDIPDYVRQRLEEEPRETLLEEKELTTPGFFEALDANDPVAREYLEDLSRFNAAGLASLINICNPGLVTVGGGVVNHQPCVLEGIERHLDDFLVVTPPRLERTKLGDRIGLYGALALPTFTESRSAAVVEPPTAASDY
jgi:glucokinase